MESGDLLSLQARMKKDPSGYEQELLLQLRHFDACFAILLVKSSGSAGGPSTTAGDAGAAKEVADVAMFLAHMAPFYPQYLKDLPKKLLQVLNLHASLPQTLRRSLTQAVILTRNRKVKTLNPLVFSSVILLSISFRNDYFGSTLKTKQNLKPHSLFAVLFALSILNFDGILVSELFEGFCDAVSGAGRPSPCFDGPSMHWGPGCEEACVSAHRS